MKRKTFFSLVCVYLILFIYSTFLYAGIKEINLSNGMQVLFKEDHRLPVVAIQLWVRAGSKNEKDSESGISHFIEHMAFKGTEKYKSREIYKEIEKRGGTINAGTSRDFTYFYIVLPSNIEAFTEKDTGAGQAGAGGAGTGLAAGLDIIFQVAVKSIFPQEEVERERLVILEEIKRKEDDPQGCLWDIFNSILYKGCGYAHPVLGNEETVKSFSREALLEYYRKNYVPENFVLVIAGDFNVESALAQIKERFGRLERISFPRQKPRTAILEQIQEKPDEFKIEKEVSQAYVMLGTSGPEGRDRDAYVMDVIAYILGKGRGSRFYRILRQQKEMVWDIECSYLTEVERGPFYIYLECEPDKIPEVRKEIAGEIKRLSEEIVPEEEIERAKALLESEHLLSTETFYGDAFNLGYYELVGSYKLGVDYLKNILKVSATDIQRVARKYLDPEKFVCVTITPSSVH